MMVMTMAQSTIKIEQQDGIAIMYLNKPPVNAIDRRLVDDGMNGLLKLSADKDIRALIITGSGKCFSAGLDLKVAPYYSLSEQRQMVEELNNIVLKLYGFPIPTVAAVNGHAIAGGFILAISCDYRIGTTAECKIGVTESRVGIPFPVSTMEVLRAELSPSVARKMVMVGRNLGPHEALQNGILDELQQPEHIFFRAKEVAMDLGAIPRDAYAQIKHQLRGNTISRIQQVMDEGSDPLLKIWIKEEGRIASSELLANKE
jgi:enoyl-CoA hydratase